MNKIKEAAQKVIIEEATNLFINKSISSVTMQDIAKKVGIGEATLYRYFGKKQNIVIQSAIYLWKIAYKDFIKIDEGKTGYEKLALFYNAFLDVFINHKEFYNFIYEFDAYFLIDNTIEKVDYEEELNLFKKMYDDALSLGNKDFSIRKQENPDIFYFSTTHSLLNLCKKLSSEGQLVHQDNLISKEDEIKCLINIILNSLKAL